MKRLGIVLGAVLLFAAIVPAIRSAGLTYGRDKLKSDTQQQGDASAPTGSATNQKCCQAALDALNEAKRQLQTATGSDGGNHRAKAVDLVNKAISEVNLALKAIQEGAAKR